MLGGSFHCGLALAQISDTNFENGTMQPIWLRSGGLLLDPKTFFQFSGSKQVKKSAYRVEGVNSTPCTLKISYQNHPIRSSCRRDTQTPGSHKSGRATTRKASDNGQRFDSEAVLCRATTSRKDNDTRIQPQAER
jgi:hypothetical protein